MEELLVFSDNKTGEKVPCRSESFLSTYSLLLLPECPSVKAQPLSE